jgi:hypothetical protein
MATREEPLDPTEVLAAYLEGVNGVDRAAVVVEDWEMASPCGQWRAVDLAGHLLAIARYYHRLLDAAAAGSPLVDLPRGRQLAAMNAEDLVRLTDGDGPERARRFVAAAREYASRLGRIDWTLTLGTWSGLGDLSIGEHTAVAVGEWHVHAWDIARSAGLDHRPNDPLTIARGQAAVGRDIGPGEPWIALLRAYGRDPEWSQSSE